jgi:hypothetical protein
MIAALTDADRASFDGGNPATGIYRALKLFCHAGESQKGRRRFVFPAGDVLCSRLCYCCG